MTQINELGDGELTTLLLGFLETAATLEKRLDRVLSGGRGISFSEYRLLRGLAAAPQGTASRVDLATAVGLTPSAVTRALKPLEKRGVVTTERSARDARQSLASLTPAGAELFREAHGMLEDLLGASAARRFSPRQIETLRTCLAELGRQAVIGLDLNAGALAPVPDEVELAALPVDGAIPPALAGTLIRNGPNPFSGRFDGEGVLSWWPESAMLHAVSFGAGQASGYRNRWVRTRRWQAHFGGAEGGALVDSNPNVNVLQHGGEILALAEGGPPVVVDLALNTLGAPRVHAAVAAGMTAHPKVDPASRELMYFHLAPQGLRYGVLDSAGRQRAEQAVALGQPGMMHDMAITATRSVLMDLNVGFDFGMLDRGFRIPVCWQPARGSRLGVLPRRGGEVRWVEIEPCFVQHVVNAWDTGPDTLVMDVVRYPWYFKPDGHGGFLPDPLGVLWRYEIDLARGAVVEGALSALNVELPRINETRTGTRHRFIYAVTQPTGIEMRGVVKFDADSGAVQTHQVAPGDQNSEPVFVPNPAGSSEDDGWLLVCVYRQATDATEVRVLDARDIREPLATVALGRRIPAGFHGAWIPN